MEIPIIIEQVDGETYRARCLKPVALEVTARARYQARDQIQALLQAALGVDHVEALQLGMDYEHPWVDSAGWMADDEMAELWQASVAEYRRQLAASEAQNPIRPVAPLTGPAPVEAGA